MNAVKSHLRSHGIPVDKDPNISDEKLSNLRVLEKLSLPKLLGSKLIHHFENMAFTMGKPYLDLAVLANENWHHASLDCSGIPKNFSKEPGWTMYMKDGKCKII
jgi:hypothetical protein